MNMDPWITLGAALVGYCAGAVSFARIITTRVSPGTDISHVQQVVPGTAEPFVMDTVSATSVHTNVGKKYGCITALMDMAKVTVPTLAMRLWQPEMPYDLIVATSGVIGHNWPVFYRFKGGRGESPIIGGLLAIDPLGLLVVNAIGSVLGIALGSMLVLRWSGFLLLIPWSWVRTHDVTRVAYVIIAVLLYVIALRSELRQYIRLKLDGKFPSQEAVAEFLAMGKGLGRMMDRYSFFALVKRLKGPGAGCLLLAGIQFFPVADARAHTALFEGEASLMLQLRGVTPLIATAYLQYFPVLSLSLPPDEEQELSGEVLLNMGYKMVSQSTRGEKAGRVRLLISGFQVRVLVGGLAEPVLCEGIRSLSAVKFPPPLPPASLFHSCPRHLFPSSFMLSEPGGEPSTAHLNLDGMAEKCTGQPSEALVDFCPQCCEDVDCSALSYLGLQAEE